MSIVNCITDLWCMVVVQRSWNFECYCQQCVSVLFCVPVLVLVLKELVLVLACTAGLDYKTATYLPNFKSPSPPKMKLWKDIQNIENEMVWNS